MDFLTHLPSPIAPTFSEALRIDTTAGSWIFISGQVGVPLPPDNGSVTFEQEVRTTFERIRGDKAHPASKGYTCEKALRLDHYQNGAHRLSSPMRRRAAAISRFALTTSRPRPAALSCSQVLTFNAAYSSGAATIRI